jgi:hypothetical protein
MFLVRALSWVTELALFTRMRLRGDKWL